MAAAWLLACHPDNTARLAMKGGLHVLVVSTLYAKGVGCVWKI